MALKYVLSPGSHFNLVLPISIMSAFDRDTLYILSSLINRFDESEWVSLVLSESRVKMKTNKPKKFDYTDNA